jgi:hypothetical protein
MDSLIEIPGPPDLRRSPRRTLHMADIPTERAKLDYISTLLRDQLNTVATIPSSADTSHFSALAFLAFPKTVELL